MSVPSTPDGGLVVDLTKLSSVTVHADGTVTIGAGARLGDVYTALAAAGRCLPRFLSYGRISGLTLAEASVPCPGSSG